MGRKSIPVSTQRRVIAEHCGTCALCKARLIDESGGAFVGIIAHIAGLQPGSARFNPEMTNEERNSSHNLLLLCPTCHAKVDQQPHSYTTESLQKIREEHLLWCQEKLTKEITEVTFAELEVVTRFLIEAQPPSEEDLHIIPPEEKIRKNALSTSVQNLITMGLSGATQVQDYLNRNPDPRFAERLRAGFVRQYESLKAQGVSGDDLFYALLDFARGNHSDFKYQAAGLKVLAYFFEICEVFEK